MSSTTSEANKLPSLTSTQMCFRFSLAEIQFATKDFDDELVIGQGGFGKVYKGSISIEETSHVVAIKRLDSMSNQGAHEFRAEIEMLSKLRHSHLVSLIGYCDENKEMVLVYAYMPHGTLYHHLHKAETPLNWMQRLKIAVGAGRGLDYLHTGAGTHHGVIHRDVKSSNILLDENWEAMISDFGLSKIGPINQSCSYVDASVKGTFGYLDPEFFYTRKLTRKTDVYAFGVVLFELLSGRLAVDDRNGEDECSLVRWAQRCVKEQKLDQIVDSKIRGTIFPKCLRGFVQIAERCLRSGLEQRPTMAELVVSLQALLELHQRYDKSAEPSGITRFTWKIHKYLVSATKPNADHSAISSSKSPENHTNQYNSTNNDGSKQGEFMPNSNFEGLLHSDHSATSSSQSPENYTNDQYNSTNNDGSEQGEFMPNNNFESLLHSGGLVRLRLTTKVKIAVEIARGIVFLQKTHEQLGANHSQVGTVSNYESPLDRHDILLDKDYTAKLPGYDVTKLVKCRDFNDTRSSVYTDIGDYHPQYRPRQPPRDFDPIKLRSNLFSFTVVFAEVLTGKYIYNINEFKNIGWLFTQHGRMSLVDIAYKCFEICNDVDSESRMLRILEEYMPAYQDVEKLKKEYLELFIVSI